VPQAAESVAALLRALGRPSRLTLRAPRATIVCVPSGSGHGSFSASAGGAYVVPTIGTSRATVGLGAR
jgi:hypothetical protein